MLNNFNLALAVADILNGRSPTGLKVAMVDRADNHWRETLQVEFVDTGTGELIRTVILMRRGLDAGMVTRITVALRANRDK